MAALLLAFEEKIEGKGLTLSDLSLSSTGSPNHSLVSTPSTTAFQFLQHFFVFLWSSFSNVSSTSRVYATKKANHCTFCREHLCSEESLWTLQSFFWNTLSTNCCYCGKLLDCESVVFNWQTYVVSEKISCVNGDSFNLLSSPNMKESPPKYYVNLR